MELSQKEKQKFVVLNTKIRQEEIRARKFYFDLVPKLDEMVKNKTISEYEIEEHYYLFSKNKAFCKSKNVEVDDPFFEEKHSSFINSNDDFFNTNWNEFSWTNSGPLKDLHFGYTMHCLLFHSDLTFEEILKTDDFWLELIVRHQFIVN